ncbi:MAG: radical SAM protein [Candidatus Njordarchaeum guaymaensis]
MHSTKFYVGQKMFNPRLFIIRMGDYCNLACSYCYIKRRNLKISLDLLDKYVELISKWSVKSEKNKLSIAFLGGEPLFFIKEIDYFITNLKRKLPKGVYKKISFKIQSNGTLITLNLVKWIKEKNIRIGISLDGPKYIHDLVRKNKNNEGSYDLTVRGIQLLQSNGIEPFIITVITKYNYNKVDEIVGNLVDLGIHYFRMNPILPIRREHWELAVSPEQFSQSMRDLINSLIKFNKNKFKIKESNLEDLLLVFLGLVPKNICFRHPCGAGLDMLVFNSDGGIYPCDNLVSKEFLMGHIDDINSIEELETNEIVQKLSLRNRPEECNRCILRSICNGGCLARINAEGRSINDRSLWYCEFYKRITPVIFEILLDEPEFIRGMLKSK